MKKKLRPVGEIKLELEKLFEELVDEHGYQMGDLLGEPLLWVPVHRPDCIETYVKDGQNPRFAYAHPDFFKCKKCGN